MHNLYPWVEGTVQFVFLKHAKTSIQDTNIETRKSGAYMCHVISRGKLLKKNALVLLPPACLQFVTIVGNLLISFCMFGELIDLLQVVASAFYKSSYQQAVRNTPTFIH